MREKEGKKTPTSIDKGNQAGKRGQPTEGWWGSRHFGKKISCDVTKNGHEGETGREPSPSRGGESDGMSTGKPVR